MGRGATFELALLLRESRLREALSAASIADRLALSRCPASVASFLSASALATASTADWVAASRETAAGDDLTENLLKMETRWP